MGDKEFWVGIGKALGECIVKFAEQLSSIVDVVVDITSELKKLFNEMPAPERKGGWKDHRGVRKYRKRRRCRYGKYVSRLHQELEEVDE